MPATPSAEAGYLFRHDLIRTAAYELQLPSARGVLHRQALELLEPGAEGDASGNLHAELARHARHAQDSAMSEHSLLELRGKEVTHAMEAAERLWGRGDEHSAYHWYRRVAALDQAEPNIRLRALLRVITVLRLRDNLPEARERIAEAEPVAARATDAQARARLVHEHGTVEATAGNFDASYRLYFEALAAYDATRDARHAGIVLGDLAANFYEQHKFDQAREYYTRAADSVRAAGDRANATSFRGGLAMAMQAAGDITGAYVEFARAMAEAREAGFKRLEATMLSYIAAIDRAQGRTTTAIENLRRSITLARESEARRAEIAALATLGLILLEQRNYTEAEGCFRRGRELALEAGLGTRAAGQLSNLACAQGQRGEVDAAIATFREAISEQLRLQNTPGAGNASADMGWLLFTAGRLGEARAALSDAEKWLENAGRVQLLGCCLCMTGLCALQQGEIDTAAAYLGRAEPMLSASSAGALHLQFVLQLKTRLHAARGNVEEAAACVEEMRRLGAQLAVPAESDAGRAIQACEALVVARD